MWYSLFNLPHRESVAAVHDRVVTPDYTSCTGDGPGDCWDKQKSIQVITSFETSIPDMKFEIKEQFAENDRVIVRGEVSGTPSGDLFGGLIPNSGKRFRVMTIDIHTIESGRIRKTYHMENWFAAMVQLRSRHQSPPLEDELTAEARMTAEEILSIHTDTFNRALKEQDYAALEGLYADDYTLVRSDGSVLSKREVLHDLRSGALRVHSIELGQNEVRMYGPTAVLTAETRTVTSQDGMESRSHFRLVAVYVQQEQSIKLVHFQSTSLGSSP
ncbi:MAG TPA: nuclear transport factor 2 family protein [Gemmatimonadaceae bacterium]|nr:nuclear transport factor 2 family protein [Gemmatimonadaceae bacterium]